MRMYPAITSPHVYIRIRKRNRSMSPTLHSTTMPNTKQTQLAEYITNAGKRLGIPISDDHAELVAKSSDSLRDAIEAVRPLEYQDHEPCNVFHPVVLADSSEKGGDQ